MSSRTDNIARVIETGNTEGLVGEMGSRGTGIKTHRLTAHQFRAGEGFTPGTKCGARVAVSGARALRIVEGVEVTCERCSK